MQISAIFKNITLKDGCDRLIKKSGDEVPILNNIMCYAVHCPIYFDESDISSQKKLTACFRRMLVELSWRRAGKAGSRHYLLW